jgi:hypothetical protein
MGLILSNWLIVCSAFLNAFGCAGEGAEAGVVRL